MKFGILLAASLLSSLSAFAATTEIQCDLATTGQPALTVAIDGEAAVFEFAGKPALRATAARGFNPYFLVFEINAGQSRTGKIYLERATLTHGRGELIDGNDSYACRL